MTRNSPKTLGEYRDACAAIGGEDCRAVEFLDEKIYLQGRDEIVVADESQMLALLGTMLFAKKTNQSNEGKKK